MANRQRDRRRQRQREAVARRAGTVAAAGDRSAGAGVDVGRSGAGLRLPGLHPLYEALIDASEEILTCPSPLAAELWVIATWGTVLASAPRHAALDLVAQDWVDVAEQDARPQSLAVLRTLAEVGPAGITEAAAQAAHRVAQRAPSIVEPEWAPALGAVTVVGCHQVADVYGESLQVVTHYSYDGGAWAHLVIATVDRSLGGVVTDLELVEGGRAVEARLAGMRETAGRSGTDLQTLDAAAAAAVLRSGLVLALDPARPGPLADLPSWPPRWSERTRTLLPLAVQRVSTMDPDPPPLAARERRGEPAGSPRPRIGWDHERPHA